MMLFLYFNSKSISKLSVEGFMDINFSPFEYFISFLIFITLIGELLTSKS